MLGREQFCAPFQSSPKNNLQCCNSLPSLKVMSFFRKGNKSGFNCY